MLCIAKRSGNIIHILDRYNNYHCTCLQVGRVVFVVGAGAVCRKKSASRLCTINACGVMSYVKPCRRRRFGLQNK